ncbi:MAG: response regulator [Candidatus Latescibacteria bacterium]|jgi:CheY-like chemotaxis protein|nr:response regulator [Candidatus Latescibacterota bacterium]
MIQSDDIADLFGEEAAPALDGEADGSGPKILVVDDSRMMRFAVAEVIRKLGYEVLEAADGDEALALAGDDLPQLIFLDINMPRMGGIDVLERLRSDPQLQTVPVVILTVEKRPDLMRRVAALRVKDYLLKPARPSEIKKRVAAYLS